jgi:hypothetical protein
MGLMWLPLTVLRLTYGGQDEAPITLVCARGGLLDDAFEEVGGLSGGLGERGSGEGVALGVAVLGEDEGAGAFHERGLRGVGLHGLES